MSTANTGFKRPFRRRALLPLIAYFGADPTRQVSQLRGQPGYRVDLYAGSYQAKLQCPGQRLTCPIYGATGHSTEHALLNGGLVTVLPNAAARRPGWLFVQGLARSRGSFYQVSGYVPESWVQAYAGQVISTIAPIQVKQRYSLAADRLTRF